MPSNIHGLAISELLPQFAIRKIVISQDSATLSCALLRPRGINYENWLGSSEFTPYIKYYFIAAPQMSAANISKFYYPHDRIKSILSDSIEINQVSLWEGALGPQSEGNADLSNPFDFKGHTILTLDEILQGQYFAQDALTATETLEPVDPYVLDNQEGYNTSFQVSIDLINDPFGARTTEFNILAFAQLDLLRLKEDFGLHSPRDLVKVGTDLLYEKCLIRSTTGQDSNNHLVVPEFRRVFFTTTGEAYYGPTHYHGADPGNNPGPNGYVGWMSGPPFGDMSTKLPLEMRSIPNSKVISKIFTNKALNPDGFALSENNSYSGYVDSAASEVVDPGSLVFGEDIIRTLRTQMGQVASLGEYQKKLKELSIIAIKRGNLNLSLAAGSPEDYSWVDINDDRGYHGSLLALRMDDLVSCNSRLGYIYDLHRNLENPSSRDFLESAIFLSKIQDFSVFRRRVTNSATGNNGVSSPKHETYDINEAEDYIIKTNSPKRRGDKVISPKSNKKAKIFEHNPRRTSKLKTIILNDFDLFQNIHTGKYKYVVDIVFEDGIVSSLQGIFLKLRKSLKEYSRYVKEASMPYQDYTQSRYYNGSQFASGPADQQQREAARTAGNYNHSIGDFTEEFKRLSLLKRNRSDDLVDDYCKVYYLLTAKDQFSREQTQMIKEALLAKNATLDSLEFFLDLSLKLERRLDDLLSISSSDIKGTLNLGTHKRRVAPSMPYPNNIIKLRGDVHVLAKAVNKNSLFIRPNILAGAGTVISAARGSIAPLSAASAFALRESNGSYTQETVVNTANSGPPGQIARGDSVITAAIEMSKAGAIVRVGATANTINDELAVADNLLSSYGGSTLESLVKSAVGTSRAEIENKEIEKDKKISKELQESVFGSVVSSDNSEIFRKQIEEKYKDLYFKKEALDGLYETVTAALSAQKMITRSSTNSPYKDKILKSTNSKEATEKEDTAKGDIFVPYTVDPSEGLVPVENNNTLGIIIYKKDSGAYEGSVMSGNVQLTDTEKETKNKESKATTQPTGRTTGGVSY